MVGKWHDVGLEGVERGVGWSGVGDSAWAVAVSGVFFCLRLLGDEVVEGGVGFHSAFMSYEEVGGRVLMDVIL